MPYGAITALYGIVVFISEIKGFLHALYGLVDGFHALAQALYIVAYGGLCFFAFLIVVEAAEFCRFPAFGVADPYRADLDIAVYDVQGIGCNITHGSADDDVIEIEFMVAVVEAPRNGIEMEREVIAAARLE